MPVSSYDTVSINRRLEGVRKKRFAHMFPGWRDYKKQRIAGVQVQFNDIFIGFKDLPAIRKTFGSSTNRVLSKLSVGVYNGDGYAWVDDEGGRLRFMISRKYLRVGRRSDIYLDVIHELVHVRQFIAGMDLWDEKFAYVDRPTEIEAYKAAVREAKRIGMPNRAIRGYLRIPWVTEKEFERLCRHVNVR